MPRAVVTGGAGFLGSHLCDRLLAEGWEVLCLDSLLTGDRRNLEIAGRQERFSFVQHNVTQFIDVRGNVDYVLHFASPASPIDYARLPIQTLKVGALGTHNALGLAKAKRARFLLASTSEVYGDPQVHPQPESYWGHVNPVGPRSMYDEAKRFAEAMTMAYHNAHGLDVRIVRIFNTYGPRMRMSDGRAVPTFLAQALNGEPVTVHGTGSQSRSLCYVDDLVEGIWRMTQSHVTGPVNLGNQDEITILELARLIVEMTDSGSTIEFVDRPEDDPEMRRPDISRARALLSWEPTVGLREGLRSTIDWAAERWRIVADGAR